MVAITIILAVSLGLLYFNADAKYLRKLPQAVFETSIVMGLVSYQRLNKLYGKWCILIIEDEKVSHIDKY